VAFCKNPYLPKALPPDGMKSWGHVIGLGDREYNWYLPSQVKDEPLFELDIFDSNAAETVIKMIESSADEAGGLHRVAIMANSGYQINSLCLHNLY
jgi:hypothetical protein